MFEELEATGLAALLPVLARIGAEGLEDGLTDAERIEAITALEQAKAAAAAAQARVTAAFAQSQRREQEIAGVRREKLGAGLGAQIGLARRESPHRGTRALGLANILVHEMPHTLAAMTTGRLSEWRATLLARETATLCLEDRRRVDRELAADPRTLHGLGDRALVAAIRRLAYRLDPDSVVRRARRAERDRTVTIRPAPDTMTYVTALLPVRQGIAVYAALSAAADSARAAGDDRSRGQLLADTLLARVTGHATPADIPVRVNLVITDRTLLRGHHEPAHLAGYGTVPAG